MNRQQQIFYNDVPVDLNFLGHVKFNSPLPKNAPAGSVLMCELHRQGGGLNALFFLVRGNSGIWHEFEPHTSRLLKDWVGMENAKVIKDKAKMDYRPWE